MIEENSISDEKQRLVESFKQAAPIILGLLSDDISIAIVEKDTRRTLFYQPGTNIDHGIRPGDICPENSVVVETAQRGERITRKAGSETFGFSYFSEGTPIRNSSGEVIAGMALSKSLEKYEKLMQAVSNIKTSIDTVSVNAQNLAANSEELLAIAHELSTASDEMNKKTSESEKVLKMIEKIAGQTRLLGLNASIEAARLGAEGAGFNVVAEEIQALAQSSVESLKQIEGSLKQIPEVNKAIKSNTDSIEAIGAKNAEDASGVDEMLQKLSEMSSMLDKMAEEL